MDTKDFMNYVRGWGFFLLIAVVLTCTIFGFVKLAIIMFPPGLSFSEQGLQACQKQGGTPIFEDHGAAYKSCAINGKSDTKNVVR